MRYALLGIALLAAAGCGGRPTQVEPGGAPGADPLRGRTFSTSQITEQGKSRPLPAGTSITLQFTEDGRLVANAGCNTMSGAVTVADGRLDAADLSMTEMGCDPERHAQDERLATFLTERPSWKLDGENLVLSSAGTELVLGQEKPLPLVGTKWQADTLIQGEVAGATPAGVDATLVFGPDQVTVSGLCNLREVPYRAAGTTITFELGPMTLMACEPEIMTVEQAAVSVLDGEATYRIDGRTLTITKDGKGLRFTAAG